MRIRTAILILVALAALTLLVSAAISSAQSDRQLSATESISAKATIVAIDKATRTITLRNAQGMESKVIAGEQVQRFDQLKVGDVIHATYSQALAVNIRKPGGPAPQEKVEKIVRDAQGAKVTQQRTVTVTVEEIDMPGVRLTVKDAKGVKSTFKVRDVANLRELKIGDKVDVTYTEGLLIRAEHPR